MKHKLVPYTEEEKCTVLKHLNYTEESLKEDIDAVMDWFGKQPHLAEAGIDPGAVRTFLFMRKGSREKVKRRIDNYYRYRGFAPDLIQSRKEALYSNKDILNGFRYVLIPRLYDGRRVVVVDFLNPDPASFSLTELFRGLYVFNDIRVTYDYFRGDIWVVDFKTITFEILLKVNPMVAQRGVQIFQDGLGFMVYAIHILNFPYFGHQFLNLLRKIVKAKILDRMIFHSSLEELHKVLPKEYLPKDYGGENISMQEFKEMYQKELRNDETKQFVLDACKQVSDEKKRPVDQISEEFLPGTFRKLNLD